MPERPAALLVLPGNEGQGIRIAEASGYPLDPLESHVHPDGEFAVRPLRSVRDRDAYLIASMHADPAGSVHDKLCRLLFLAGAVADAGAARVTILAPYLCYGRQDRRSRPRETLALRYLAQMIEAVDVDRVVAFDVHNRSAFENAFRRPVEPLELRPLMVAHLIEAIADDALSVISPDFGGMKRAEQYRADLTRVLGREIDLGFVEKRREGESVRTSALVGDVAGRTVLIVDDMIVTGGTIGEAVRRCREMGARRVLVAATHGLLTDGAAAILADVSIDGVWLGDTIDPPLPATRRLGNKLRIVPVAPLAALAIAALQRGAPLTPLVAPVTPAAIEALRRGGPLPAMGEGEV